MAMDCKEIEKRAEAVAAPILANLGYSLVACEFTFEDGRWQLRLFVDREGGVTVGDCARASHAVEDAIAVEDFIPAAYNLEVSSPGIFRPLRTEDDFKRYTGERARIKTVEPIGGRSNFRGILIGVEGGQVAVSIDGTKFTVPMEKIGRARLDPVEVMPAKGERRVAG